jgi:hypothetical protein
VTSVVTSVVTNGVTSRGRLAWLVTGAVVTVVLIASGCLPMWYLTSYQAKTYRLVQRASYAGQPAGLVVRLTSGDITVLAGRAGQVEVTRELEWSAAKPVIDESWQGHAFDIQQDCPTGLFDQTCAVNYTIAVPPGVTVSASTDGGTINVARLDGRLTLASQSGGITVTGSRSAEVQASTYSGDVRLSFTAAPIFVRGDTLSGDVSIAVPLGKSYDVAANTAAGNQVIRVSQNPAAPQYISASTDSGNILVAYN